ncbi:O-antigen ligase family protein [Cellulosimicrobium sp. NPDC057127]|uniref:O-antigen ligase family protein n=1 Tax=Cellulosimicrobium sp. NPDC057127 TaxID=3346026 RepID=UPI00362BE42A
MIAVLCLAVVLAVAALLGCLSWGWRNVVLLAFVLSVAVFPRRLLGDPVAYAGVAPGAPQLSTFGLVLVVGSLVAVLARSARGGLAVLPVLVWTGVASVTVWTPSPVLVSGLLHVALMALAWVLGTSLSGARASSSKDQLFYARVVAGAVLVQLGTVLLQLAGLDLNPMRPQTAAIMEWRLNGTMDHPNTLGKVLLLLLAMALPGTVSVQRAVRRTSSVAVLACFPPLLLSGGRANITAAVMTVLVWVVVQRRESVLRGMRAYLLIGGALLGGTFAGRVVERFREDPDGGSRAALTDRALEVIPQNLLLGVGPNSWVDVVGRFDPLTAAGLPVHNAVLLVVGELGVVGAVLLLAPAGATVLLAFRRRRDGGQAGAAATAVVAALPGLLLVMLTGWGMVAGNVAMLWMFFLGGSTAAMTRTRTPEPDCTTVDAPTGTYSRGTV